jgi:hypothetical protein
MKIVCKTSQGSTTTWWRWRIIDGKKCWYPGKAVIDKSQLTWEPPEVVVKREFLVEPKPSPPELALPKSTDLPGSTVLPALSLPAKNQDRLQVEDNLGSPKPIRQVIPGLQQYEVKTVTAEPDKPSPSHWPEFALLVAGALMLVVGYVAWRRESRKIAIEHESSNSNRVLSRTCS